MIQCSNSPWQAAPIDPTWIIAGTPKAEISFLGSSGPLSSGLWQCTAGRFHWHYHVNETISLIAGSVMIRDCADTVWHHLSPGDSMLFPKGSSAEWIVENYVRKFYAIEDRRSIFRRVRDKLIRSVTTNGE